VQQGYHNVQRVRHVLQALDHRAGLVRRLLCRACAERVWGEAVAAYLLPHYRVRSVAQEQANSALSCGALMQAVVVFCPPAGKQLNCQMATQNFPNKDAFKPKK
jgi:hypothetical protein